MFYAILGRLVWKVAKLVLRRRYGSSYLPKPALAGGVVALVIGAVGFVRAVRG
jgi:hypothetical protein